MSPRSKNARAVSDAGSVPVARHVGPQRLLREAEAARRHAYAPYSRFAVGAALLTRSGRIVHGCNIENSSFGLSVCAERTALWNAVTEGEREFVAVAVTAGPNASASPCGACRQVLHEFAPDLWVYWRDVRGRIIGRKLEELLAEPFRFADAVARGADARAARSDRRVAASRRSNGRRGALPRVSPRRRAGAPGS
jgi:cytidine deaminase